VLRCFALLSTRSRALSRFLENLSFGITSSMAVLVLPRPNVIYSITWPFLATGLILAVAQLRGIPVVMSLQDIYPESLISQERLRPESRAAGFLRRVDGCIARRGAALVAISQSFAEHYQATRHVAPEKITVVPNWLSSRTIKPYDPESATVRAQFGIPVAARLAVYGGNIGIAAGVETLIEAFQSLGSATHLHLLIAGEGSQLAACRRHARKASCGTISFFTPWPEAETSRVLGAADLLILPTRGQQSLASVPSKLITYMLAARPVIALALPESDLAKTIQLAGCGWVVDPDQPELLANKIREVAQLPDCELTRLGTAGRDYALQHFVREICLPKVVRVVEQAAARG
jgi:colanic acid biosynthesis glycosyl transferase WcaI